MVFLHSIANWWTTHPGWVGFIYLVLAVLLGWYPAQSKKLLILPFFYTGLGGMRLMQRKAKRDLAIIRMVNGDAFKLVAYLGYYCLDAIGSAMWWTFAAFIITLAANHFHLGFEDGSLIRMAFIGTVIGRGCALYFFLQDLLNPEAAIKKLEKMAAGERLD